MSTDPLAEALTQDERRGLLAQPAAAPSGDDVADLAQQMREYHDGWTDVHVASVEDRAYAEAVLASDWLTAHIARAALDAFAGLIGGEVA